MSRYCTANSRHCTLCIGPKKTEPKLGFCFKKDRRTGPPKIKGPLPLYSECNYLFIFSYKYDIFLACVRVDDTNCEFSVSWLECFVWRCSALGYYRVTQLGTSPDGAAPAGLASLKYKVTQNSSMWLVRMSHRKWRETKQQPSRAKQAIKSAVA